VALTEVKAKAPWHLAASVVKPVVPRLEQCIEQVMHTSWHDAFQALAAHVAEEAVCLTRACMSHVLSSQQEASSLLRVCAKSCACTCLPVRYDGCIDAKPQILHHSLHCGCICIFLCCLLPQHLLPLHHQ